MSSDIVITGAHSTVALESLSLGCPTIVVRDETGFSMSPVLTIPAAYIVNTSQEVSDALNLTYCADKLDGLLDHDSAICISENLDAWQGILDKLFSEND